MVIAAVGVQTLGGGAVAGCACCGSAGRPGTAGFRRAGGTPPGRLRRSASGLGWAGWRPVTSDGPVGRCGTPFSLPRAGPARGVRARPRRGELVRPDRAHAALSDCFPSPRSKMALLTCPCRCPGHVLPRSAAAWRHPSSLSVTVRGLTYSAAAPMLVGVVEGAAAVHRGQSGLPRVLTAAETAAPVDAVDVVAEDLRRRFRATEVSFLIVDLTGKAVARLSTVPADGGREAERIPCSAASTRKWFVPSGCITRRPATGIG